MGSSIDFSLNPCYGCSKASTISYNHGTLCPVGIKLKELNDLRIKLENIREMLKI